MRQVAFALLVWMSAVSTIPLSLNVDSIASFAGTAVNKTVQTPLANSKVVVSVEAIQKKVTLGDKWILPKTVKVKFKDGVTRSIGVKWPSPVLIPNKVGTTIHYGMLIGFNVKVKATVICTAKIMPTIPAPSVETTKPLPLEGIAIEKRKDRDYQVTASVALKNDRLSFKELNLWLPVPRTNEYQTVVNVDLNGAQEELITATGDLMAKHSITANQLPAGSSTSLKITYRVTLNDIKTAVDRIEVIHPYNKDSDVYKMYTGSDQAFIDPENPQIKEIVSKLSAESENDLVFAKKAYEYVASHYKYLDPNTGIHPLSYTLKIGGGDCGNLTAIWVSIVRSKGIPARPLVALRPDGTTHIWGDFYLEKYGWIPVDVNYKLDNPDGNYFGIVRAKDNGIILSTSYGIPLQFDGKEYMSPLLQLYYFRYSQSQLLPGTGIDFIDSKFLLDAAVKFD